MSKETWAQFMDRVKPKVGQIFKDIYGEDWLYSKYGYFYMTEHEDVGVSACMTNISAGHFIPCSLVDAIEHVEKPKLKNLTCYCYLALDDGLYWTTKGHMKDPRALDENGNQITKDVWVEDYD